MNFTVEYRNVKTGQREAIILDVPTKADVWPILKERGISPISVTPGVKKTAKSSSLKQRQISGSVKVVASLIVIIVIAVCSYFLLRKDPNAPVEPSDTPSQQKTPEPKRSQIKPETRDNDIPPSIATTGEIPQAVEIEAPKPNPKLAPSTAKKYPRRVIPRRPEPPQRFKYNSDDLIAGFLEIEPGTPMEGGLMFNKIARDFEKSLTEDVALADDQDTPENRELQKYVRETKKEIQELMRKEGKTFAQVMEEQFDQLIELGQYKRDLQATLREYKKSGEYSAEEYEKFVEAANHMLGEKGLEPLKIPRATYYQLELYKSRRAAAQAYEQQ